MWESVLYSCFRVVLDVLALFGPLYHRVELTYVYRVGITLEGDVRALSCYYFFIGWINFVTF